MIVAALGVGLGVATLNLAQADDAPGLGLIGFMLIGGAAVFGLRRQRR
ncbi:LPXTG cell wall anchor domain-containing protein [Solirubrobacter sp. CPCC 204708]|nr:LPXTG cell wall anchor domain-containing protein [Solirubrobacter deserti]